MFVINYSVEFSGSYLDKDNHLVSWGEHSEGGEYIFDKADGVYTIYCYTRVENSDDIKLQSSSKGCMLIVRPQSVESWRRPRSGLYEQSTELYNSLLTDIDDNRDVK